MRDRNLRERSAIGLATLAGLITTLLLTMSIKSDKWIRAQAESSRMIEPFVANQVRESTCQI
jgi:hypothetical protein